MNNRPPIIYRVWLNDGSHEVLAWVPVAANYEDLFRFAFERMLDCGFSDYQWELIESPTHRQIDEGRENTKEVWPEAVALGR